ncbi:hypothetical protein [Campylobacter magnus]|uniref:Uncharacterized protein n=1 Tax=Campylobacter magnus TaxID=3026462 RepID=A0ABT8TCX9_9BACT|nr:hypothetical protein [Campylobacter magnus]MDO2410126.1 hypothetical protein [Campylobacter magnus]
MCLRIIHHKRTSSPSGLGWIIPHPLPQSQGQRVMRITLCAHKFGKGMRLAGASAIAVK